MLYHSGKQLKDFRVPSIWDSLSVIIYQEFERWQEVLIEDRVALIVLFEDIGLNESQNVTPH